MLFIYSIIAFSNGQHVSIVSDNGLAPSKGQAIIWTNADPFHWRIYAALGGDQLSFYLLVQAVVWCLPGIKALPVQMSTCRNTFQWQLNQIQTVSWCGYVDGLVLERRNSSALVMGLSRFNLLIWSCLQNDGYGWDTALSVPNGSQ